MSIFDKDKKPPAMRPEDFAPNRQPRREMAQAAAEAMQRWIDLEAELLWHRDQLAKLRAQLDVAQQRIAELGTDLVNTRADNERLVRENQTFHTRLASVTEQIISIMRPIQAYSIIEQGDAQPDPDMKKLEKQLMHPDQEGQK